MIKISKNRSVYIFGSVSLVIYFIYFSCDTVISYMLHIYCHVVISSIRPTQEPYVATY